MTRATASPELPRHLPRAGKTRSKVNRSRSAAGAGLGAQRRGRAARTEVRTSGCLARLPSRPPRPPTPESPPARAAASCHRCRRPHLWQRGRGERPARQAERRTRPCAHLRRTRGSLLLLQAFPCSSDRTELPAARPGREGAGTRTAPGGARTNLAGGATPAACPAPKSETPGWSWRGRARRLPGAAEPLRSPRYPFSGRPTRSAPLEASPLHSVAGGGAGPSRDTCLLGLCALHGVPTAPVDKGAVASPWTNAPAVTDGVAGTMASDSLEDSPSDGSGATGGPQMSKKEIHFVLGSFHSLEFRLTHLGQAMELGSLTEDCRPLQTLGWQPSALRSLTEGTG